MKLQGNGGATFNVAKILKAVLIRRDYLHHIKETYSNFKDHLKDFGTLDFYDSLAPKADKDGDDDYESEEKEEDA